MNKEATGWSSNLPSKSNCQRPTPPLAVSPSSTIRTRWNPVCYAAVLADVAKENVWLVEWYVDDPDPNVKWVDRVLYIRDENRGNFFFMGCLTRGRQWELIVLIEWHPIRACFRYLTQKPWNGPPLNTKTIVMNQIISCLAGGRNKMMAARAYDFYNADISKRVSTSEHPKPLIMSRGEKSRFGSIPWAAMQYSRYRTAMQV